MSFRAPRYVDPLDDIGALLLEVAKPARYVGGEHGRLAKRDAELRTLIAFPDLYEIGMSNQALRIIYNGLNRVPGVSCDRAFAPAPDFEKLLRDKGLPLYGLDTGIALGDLDLLLFTLGYELGFSGVLSMLDASGVAPRCADRGDGDPVVMAGGPATSNPLPYCNFIDAFWIGEAEAGFFDLADELLKIKRDCASRPEARAATLARLRAHPNVWMKGKDRAVRAAHAGFGLGPFDQAAVYPVPSMKVVQQHGALEIMRGCPNGCRFCHAGHWYRPMRQKPREALVREAEAFVNLGGYREISLSSLSSGDYSGIGELVDELNDRFSGKRVSFQLPSLRVSTFSLSLLEKISRTRKSGLTFAVETPLDFWQMALNKRTSEDSVAEILLEAKRNGWRVAKFYFMIGLPLPPAEVCEEEEIVNFVVNVSRRTAMRFNVNVGVFVPKPHTPFQWARQLDEKTAFAKLDRIRSALKPKGHKVSVSETLISTIEGVLSRGDERAGDLAEEAFRRGSRLDAWQEYLSKDAWRDALAENEGMARGFLSARDPNARLPWGPISPGVSAAHLRREFEKSGKGETTPPCAEGCGDSDRAIPCGVCGKDARLSRARTDRAEGEGGRPRSALGEKNAADLAVWRMLFDFSKEGVAVFHGHLSLIEIFSMAMNRAGVEATYTRGFNPLLKLEIVAPLSMGVRAGGEMAAVDFPLEFPADEFVAKMNAALPEGFRVNRAECYRIPPGGKKRSLSSLLWGFAYDGPNGETAYVPAAEEKAFREKSLGPGASVLSLRRARALAKNAAADGAGDPWASYFDVYRRFYG